MAVSPVPPVQVTVGTELRKKLGGKLMVIWFAPAAAYAVASLKPTVTTAVLAAAAVFGTRCAAVIENVTPVTCPPKAPELTAVLRMSWVDSTVTTNPQPVPSVGGPVATLLNVQTLAVVSHPVVVVVSTN